MQNARAGETKRREEAPAGTKAERQQRRKQNPGRDETRLKRETQSERETTSNVSLKLELVRRALLYREGATAFVVLHVESDLTSTPTGAVRGPHLAPLAPLIRAAHARDCIRRARVRTPSTAILLTGDILLAILFTGDIIDWRYFAWRYFAGDISSVNRFLSPSQNFLLDFTKHLLHFKIHIIV